MSLNRQQKKDLAALLDYTQDQNELDDFCDYLADAGVRKSLIKELREKNWDHRAYKLVCSNPAETHVYAVAWRLRKLLTKEKP